MTRPGLFHQKVTAPGPQPARWLLFLHGVFGSGRNWATIARQLVERRPDYGAMLVDLRGHGRTPALPAPHNLAAAAGDVAQLIRTQGLQDWAVLGHSFGGKVALRLAQQRPPGLRAVWIIDAPPGPRAPGGPAWHMLDVLRTLPGPFASRPNALAALREAGLSDALAQWMSANLHAAEDGMLRWRIDLAVLEALLQDFSQSDLWHTLELADQVPMHLVKAQGADVVSEQDCRRVEQDTRATLHRLDGGHWLHVDNPAGLLELLAKGL